PAKMNREAFMRSWSGYVLSPAHRSIAYYLRIAGLALLAPLQLWLVSRLLKPRKSCRRVGRLGIAPSVTLLLAMLSIPGCREAAPSSPRSSSTDTRRSLIAVDSTAVDLGWIYPNESRTATIKVRNLGVKACSIELGIPTCSCLELLSSPGAVPF